MLAAERKKTAPGEEPVELWNKMNKSPIIQNKKVYRWFYNNVGRYYYNIMIKWCFFPLGGEKRCRNQLISHIKFSSSETILDMCCGTGGVTRAILKKAGKENQIIGMDLSSGLLKQASKCRDLHDVLFVEGDASKTCFRDGIFDKVFITHALHEMIRDTRIAVLREARRITKDNGKLFVLDLDEPENLILRIFFGFWFFYWVPFNPESPTRKDLFKCGVVNEVKEAGFKEVTKESKFHGLFQKVQGTK